MIIYEVSLAIDLDIYSQFEVWLKKHIKEMLKLPGFSQAHILKPEKEGKEIANTEILIVHYHLENRKALAVYFTEFASKMREEGIALFKDKFSAKRTIYEVL